MQNTAKERFKYHPDPQMTLGGEIARGSLRRVDARKEAILEHVDLIDKSLLDLGCSGGYFGFSMAETVKSYLGIDGDSELVARNNEFADRSGLHHLHFEHCQITPNLIRRLPNFDVVLFLSVYHHMLAVSKAYEWNQEKEWDPIEVLVALAEKTKVLVFETGYPDEGHEWCGRLPKMVPNPQEWIRKMLIEAGFRPIEVITAPAHRGFVGNLRAQLANSFRGHGVDRTLTARIAQRVFRLDPRDGRDIFIARGML